MSYLTQFAVAVAGATVETLTGDVGGAISPTANNINLLGGNVLTTTGAGSTITFDLDNGTDGQVLIGGGADPAWATMASADGSITFTLGANTIDLSVASSAALDVITDSGTATEAAGEIDILGGTDVTTSGAGSTVTISSSGTTTLTVTALTDASSPYTVLAADQYLTCDVSSGVLTIDFPDAPATGRTFHVKDSGGDAGTNNITVTTVGAAVTIDGATTFVMNTAYQSVNLLFNGTSYEIF